MPHRRTAVVLAARIGLLGALALLPGCAADRRRITPTTSGSDLTRLPPGRMTPQPLPGSSLARVNRPARRGAGPTGDPAAIAASAR